MQEMATHSRCFWLLNAYWKKHLEKKYGEYAYWCEGVKG